MVTLQIFQVWEDNLLLIEMWRINVGVLALLHPGNSYLSTGNGNCRSGKVGKKIDLIGNGTVLWGLSVDLVTSKRCAIRRWVTEDGKLNRKVF